MKSLLICFVCICSFLLGEMTSFEKGIKSYNARAENAVGLKAQAGPINYAIKEFIKVQNNPEEELESGIYLLRCYYYKGKFVAESDEQKKTVFNDGKALGERLIESYPESAPARYWYLVNLGSWAEVYGILSAAKEGVADLMRDHSNKIIQLDPEYSNGGGYLNAALRWSFVESLHLELDLNNLLFDDEKVEYFKREIKITYIEYF